MNNWKDATRVFQKHENSQVHIESVEKVIVKGDKHIDEVMSEKNQKQKEENRRCLLQIVKSLRYLARQSLAISVGDKKLDQIFLYTNLSLNAKE